MIGVAVEIQHVIGDDVPLRDMVIMFYITNESISLIENVSEFLKKKKKIKDIFIQLRDKGE